MTLPTPVGNAGTLKSRMLTNSLFQRVHQNVKTMFSKKVKWQYSLGKKNLLCNVFLYLINRNHFMKSWLLMKMLSVEPYQSKI